jgi:hypothetical protein
LFQYRFIFGQRARLCTVVIDRPRYAEVQVNVKGYVRTDVVFNPGEVNFGTIEAGEPQTKKVALSDAGRNDWKITNVRTPSEFVIAEVKEANRGKGRVSYELEVSVKEGAPVGPLQNELILETNDQRIKSVALRYTADIEPRLSVSPKTIDLKISLQVDRYSNGSWFVERSLSRSPASPWMGSRLIIKEQKKPKRFI